MDLNGLLAVSKGTCNSQSDDAMASHLMDLNENSSPFYGSYRFLLCAKSHFRLFEYLEENTLNLPVIHHLEFPGGMNRTCNEFMITLREVGTYKEVALHPRAKMVIV